MKNNNVHNLMGFTEHSEKLCCVCCTKLFMGVCFVLKENCSITLLTTCYISLFVVTFGEARLIWDISAYFRWLMAL